ncbi:hypothetical protein K469DRAFT_714493 [Zopfia rhizophila CBS 207.26]|uniref:Uncharacterized protein n=1 Tax=Zopfia rhizophila CBS 207.26 TaxID=1314779 RepID=A0A6A6DN82_9PEZI|nr:hypothetical protein K469DRAFT_714493 [Zopfia rhizophila CBS 207.26]
MQHMLAGMAQHIHSRHTTHLSIPLFIKPALYRLMTLQDGKPDVDKFCKIFTSIQAV